MKMDGAEASMRATRVAPGGRLFPVDNGPRESRVPLGAVLEDISTVSRELLDHTSVNACRSRRPGSRTAPLFRSSTRNSTRTARVGLRELQHPTALKGAQLQRRGGGTPRGHAIHYELVLNLWNPPLPEQHTGRGETGLGTRRFASGN